MDELLTMALTVSLVFVRLFDATSKGQFTIKAECLDPRGSVITTLSVSG